MPGRAEPAGYVEGENAKVEGNERKRDDGGGADAGVGNVDLRLGIGGRTVLIIRQADTWRRGIWSRASSRVRRLVVEKTNRLRGCSGSRGQKALDEDFCRGER